MNVAESYTRPAVKLVATVRASRLAGLLVLAVGLLIAPYAGGGNVYRVGMIHYGRASRSRAGG